MKNLRSLGLTVGVQDQIRSYISTQGLSVGDMIPTEKQLESELGISRTSIREALRSLEAIGVVETRHGVGRFLRGFNFDAMVASLSYNTEVSVKNFSDVIAVRMALEYTFLPRVIPLLSDQNITELREILAEMGRLIQSDSGDEDALISLHTEFHRTLYRPLDNHLLTHLIEMFSRLQRSLTYLHEYRTSDTGEFVELHSRLVDALEVRDVEMAEARLQEHFKDVIEWNSSQKARAKEGD